jgi:hypothetical protein
MKMKLLIQTKNTLCSKQVCNFVFLKFSESFEQVGEELRMKNVKLEKENEELKEKLKKLENAIKSTSPILFQK